MAYVIAHGLKLLGGMAGGWVAGRHGGTGEEFDPEQGLVVVRVVAVAMAEPFPGQFRFGSPTVLRSGSRAFRPTGSARCKPKLLAMG